jgi:hypothetical protein
MRFLRAAFFLGAIFFGFALAILAPARGRAQGALLLQDADGIAAFVSPVGHDALYFARICAASLTKLRRCRPGELGVVISRYRAMSGHDWLAIPVIPYLYSVDDPSEVPDHADDEIVERLRTTYHDAHLISLGNVAEKRGMGPGWNQLVGAAYERRIYAFRFETTPQQDDAFIARMNAEANRSHFNMLFRNCADFSAGVLDFYFPGAFRRHIVPDGGLVTPRQVAYSLVRYGRKHSEVGLTVLQIPLVPGYHHKSRLGMTVTESMIATGYVVPIAFLSPYAGGVLVADCLMWGREPLPVKHAEVVTPQTMDLLKSGAVTARDHPGTATQSRNTAGQ